MLKKIRTSLVASAIGITFALGNAQAVTPVLDLSGVVIFGDSLSDTGNVFSLTTKFTGTSFPSFPGAAGRFSDGPAWTETLASGLGFASSALPSNLFYNPLFPDSSLPAFIPSGVMSIAAPGAISGQNFSFGGARTGRDGSAGKGTGLLGQLVAWDDPASIVVGGPLTRQAEANTLYVVVAGANDLRDIRTAISAADAPSVQARADAAAGIAENVKNTLELLANAGARRFLISNLPDLGLTPEAVGLGVVDASSDVTIAFNSALASKAASFENVFNLANGVDLDIRTLDFYGLFNQVAADATGNGGATYGITNIASACISPGAGSGEYFFGDATAVNCDVAGFSDPLHPSGAAHALLGTLALTTVTAVPEPSEFALMIGGLLLIGGAVRRRAKAA